MTRLTFRQISDLKLILSVEGIGPAKFRALLAKFKTIDNILKAGFNDLTQIQGVDRILSQRIREANKKKDEIEQLTEKELKKLDKLNGRIITIWDDEYPALLKKIYDPPILIYAIGSFDERDNFSIAVVGTRTPTNYGKVQAERIVADLANQNITITSGLARGIDSIAHNTALKNNSRTMAVIGSGLDVIYPAENKRLFEEISEKGMIISEYELGTQPDAVNFPRRNRIISGLSLGTIVIESGIEGGAMQTARLALDQNREVFAVPGNIGVKQAEGPNLKIQKGEAKLITSAEDVLIELELKLKPIIGKNIPKPRPELSMFEEKVYSSLDSSPLHIDKISGITNLSTSDCLVHLLSLEFKGLVKQLPGKVFAKL